MDGWMDGWIEKGGEGGGGEEKSCEQQPYNLMLARHDNDMT